MCDLRMIKEKKMLVEFPQDRTKRQKQGTYVSKLRCGGEQRVSGLMPT